MNLNKRKTIVQRIMIAVLCAAAAAGGMFCRADADEKAAILQSITKDDTICLFISGLGEFNAVTGQIGREPVEIVNTTEDIGGHTIIMIDNSLSVTKDNMAKAKDILKQYIENKTEDEKISLAVYGADIQFLTEKETEKEQLMEALEGIANEDKDTYLTDVLYDELQTLEGKTEYTKFIVVTDGVDNKEIGYTKEELSEYLKSNPYPVYSLGCKYKSNDEQLKNLFAISRLTNAGYYLLDDYEEYDEIEGGLHEAVTCVEIKIPDELKDGGEKNILLSFEEMNGTVEISNKLAMPFSVKEEEPTPEPAEEEKTPAEEEEIPAAEGKSAAEDTPIALAEPAEEAVSEKTSIDLVSVGAITVIVIAFIILVIVNLSRKNKSKDNKSKKNRNKDNKSKNAVPDMEEADCKTVLAEPEDYGNATVFLDSMNQTGYIIVLRDNSEENKVFRYPLSGKITIGRKYGDGVNIVLNYEPTVSAKHCEISILGDRFYIKDLHSSNGTFVNGKKVVESMEFASGSHIKLGNLELIVEVEQTRQY